MMIKRILTLILIAITVLLPVACAPVKVTEAKKNDYILSKEAEEGSVINGVMTDIAADDPILQKTTAAWLDTCVLYEVNIRQYTEEGTFAAFEKHLDRLREMGVNTLWLMPIHPISETGRKGSLGSYYAVSDYKGVNPEFGTIEDFQHLLDKAHGMGFKVILDWVANHTGWDNAWVKEHDDWYEHTDSGKIASPYDWTDTAELNYDNYEMRAEMIDAMRYWVEDIGIDGFRCDHAVGVPMPFWNAAVYKLKSINSEIMMLAEASAAESLTTYAFDSCYNDALYGQALMTKEGVAVSSIQDGMAVGERFVEGSFPMNYLDNHDKNSYEGTIVGRFGDTYEPLLALTFLAPGIPLIYTADEEGYDHEIEFFEKDTVKWEAEPKYDALITALSKLKAEEPALASTNRALDILESDNSKVFGFSRTSGGNTVLYVSNLYYEAVEDISVTLGVDKATCVLHYDGKTLDTETAEITGNDFLHKNYNPYEFYVLTVTTEA